MGGRGQKYTVIKRLPNFRHAVIPRRKLKNYFLNPSKDKNKAAFFRSIGYNMRNWKRFVTDVKRKAGTNKALKYETDKYGNTAYQINMSLGITKKHMVTTGWIIRKGSRIPQLVTAYPNDKFGKGDKK